MTTPPRAVPSSFVRTRPETSVAAVNWRACSMAFCPVEPSRTSSTVRHAGRHLLRDALDLGQLVHQVLLVVEAASGVDQDDIVSLGDRAFDGVKRHGGGVGILALGDEVGPGAFGPDPQLVHGGGPERVRGPDGHLQAALGELVAKLADGGGLADAVDPHDQEHVGSIGLGQVEVGLGWSPR